MTVWLTRILPSPTSAEARRDLSGNAQGIRLHQRVMQLFPDGVKARPGRHSECCSVLRKPCVDRRSSCRVA